MEEIQDILRQLYNLRLTRQEHAMIQGVEQRVLKAVAALEAQLEAEKEARDHAEK